MKNDKLKYFDGDKAIKLECKLKEPRFYLGDIEEIRKYAKVVKTLSDNQFLVDMYLLTMVGKELVLFHSKFASSDEVNEAKRIYALLFDNLQFD